LNHFRVIPFVVGTLDSVLRLPTF